MTERRRFTLAGYGVFDEAMRPVDVGDEINVIETFPGDEIINDDELPELTANEQAAMDQATDDFKAWMERREKLGTLTENDWLQIEQAARGAVGGTSDEWPVLVRAIEKVLDRKLMRQPASWLRGFCEALVLSR